VTSNARQQDQQTKETTRPIDNAGEYQTHVIPTEATSKAGKTTQEQHYNYKQHLHTIRDLYSHGTPEPRRHEGRARKRGTTSNQDETDTHTKTNQEAEVDTTCGTEEAKLTTE